MTRAASTTHRRIQCVVLAGVSASRSTDDIVKRTYAALKEH
jgi:hypothetical protein